MNRLAHRLVLLATRVLVVLLALELGGAPGLIALDCCALDADACGTEDSDPPCRDCPPECPFCHCVHGSLADAAPRTTVTLPPEAPNEGAPVPRPYEADAPRAPPPSSIERPPKSPLLAG